MGLAPPTRQRLVPSRHERFLLHRNNRARSFPALMIGPDSWYNEILRSHFPAGLVRARDQPTATPPVEGPA